MGKGRVLTAHGEGRYTIELIEDRTRAEAEHTLAEQRITTLDERLTELEADLSDAQAGVDSAADTLDQAIAAYQAKATDGDEEPIDELKLKMNKAGEMLIGAAALRDGIAANIRALKMERLALQRRIDRIDALPALRQQEAWCADFTEDLSGDVATAEVPGEIGDVIVQPAYDGDEVTGWPVGVQGGAVWNAELDGAIQPALSGTPASVFYSLAMMPGWQKWRPTFRIATISNIQNDLCDIALDSAVSSEQGLDVNSQSSYTGVPIYYMECNAGAFIDGDKVLVAFASDPEKPMVVGFEKEPRACRPEIWIAFLNRSVGFTDEGWAVDEGVYSQQYTPAEPEEGLKAPFPVWQEDIDQFNLVMGERAMEWAGRCLCGVLRLTEDDVWYVAPDNTAPVALHVTGELAPTDLTPTDIENASLAVDSDDFRGRITLMFSSEEIDESPATAWDLIQPIVQAFVDQHGEKYKAVRLMLVSTENADNYPGYGARWLRWLTVDDYDGGLLNNLDPASEVTFYSSRTW